MPSPSGTLDRLLNPGSMLASMIMPSLRPITAQTLRAQALIDLANTACALEQWRGQQGSYPKDLAQLANTTPLPADQHSGKALHYRLQADGSFRVWCIGPDLKDDQGNRGKFAAGKITSLSDQGDWVWGGP
jgi:type II secretory pathway pseudopilin PulG